MAQSNALTCSGLVRALLCGVLAGVPGCLVQDAASKAKEEQERLDTKRLDDFYEMEWVKCVNDLGMDRCRIIQETGFQHCGNQRTVSNQTSRNSCIDDRLQDRLKSLTPKAENARAAPPFSNNPLLPEAADEG